MQSSTAFTHLFILTIGLLLPGTVRPFLAPTSRRTASFQKFGIPLFFSQEEDNVPLSPEKSFGADAVPEDQRPVNEFLDVTNQPLFGWAQTGNKGLLTRLAIVYSVLFAAV